MEDDFWPEIDAIEGFEGAAPRTFPRFFAVAGAEGTRRDACALAAALAERGEAVTDPDRADLIVAGSAPDGAPGRVAVDPSERALLEGAACPVAVAPRGLAERDGYELRRIDVGLDGGRGAAAALDTAVRLALDHGARLRLIAVAGLDFDRAGRTRGADPRERGRLAHRLSQATEGLVGVLVETELREGLPDQILVGLARDADLLVLGSRASYGNAGRTVIGTVAARVLRSSPVPVLLVPAP